MSEKSMVWKLSPICKEYLWGGTRLQTLFGRDNHGKKIAESWEVSIHPDGVCGCGRETLAEVLAAHPQWVDRACSPFPVLVKLIDADRDLSVQVHPDDAFARANEGDNGKTEMWYVVEAQKGAGIYCGFSRDTDRREFLRKVREGTVQELLRFVPVQAGDCFLIRAGTVHSIGAGCLICEVQQSSNVSYRVYDYNRRNAKGELRQLHVEKAAQVVRYEQFRDETQSGAFLPVQGGTMRLLTQCEYFRCRRLCLAGTYAESARNSFRTLNVLAGEGEICGQPFRAGDSFFVPCGARFRVTGNADILLTDTENIRRGAEK